MSMQSYGDPKGRNVSIAAGRVGGNQSQGAGTLPAKVSVPLPGTGATQKPYTGGQKSSPAGFNGALINGKV